MTDDAVRTQERRILSGVSANGESYQASAPIIRTSLSASRLVMPPVAGLDRLAPFGGCRKGRRNTSDGFRVWNDHKTPIDTPPRHTSSSGPTFPYPPRAEARPGCCRERHAGGRAEVAAAPCRLSTPERREESWLHWRSAARQSER